MNPEVKAKWVAALRSGKYAQTTGTLCRTEPSYGNPSGYCCLGVLCEIAFESGVEIERKKEFGRMYYDNCSGYPPKWVGQWADLGDEAQGLVAKMNDNGHTFNQIADHIEKNL